MNLKDFGKTPKTQLPEPPALLDTPLDPQMLSLNQFRQQQALAMLTQSRILCGTVFAATQNNELSPAVLAQLHQDALTIANLTEAK